MTKNKDLGAETCSQATSQARAGLGRSGFDQGERLLSLASRCEQAAGPNQELDEAIHQLVEPDCHWSSMETFGGAGGYTHSLDTVMTLIPKGVKWGIGNPLDGYYYATMGGIPRAVRAASPALALCAAALKRAKEDGGFET